MIIYPPLGPKPFSGHTVKQLTLKISEVNLEFDLQDLGA